MRLNILFFIIFISSSQAQVLKTNDFVISTLVEFNNGKIIGDFEYNDTLYIYIQDTFNSQRCVTYYKEKLFGADSCTFLYENHVNPNVNYKRSVVFHYYSNDINKVIYTYYTAHLEEGTLTFENNKIINNNHSKTYIQRSLEPEDVSKKKRFQFCGNPPRRRVR